MKIFFGKCLQPASDFGFRAFEQSVYSTVLAMVVIWVVGPFQIYRKKEDPYHPTLTRTIVQINRKCPVQKMTIREP